MKVAQMINAKTFLRGQSELYKLEFADKGDPKLMECVEEFESALEVFQHYENALTRLGREKREYERQIKILTNDK